MCGGDNNTKSLPDMLFTEHWLFLLFLFGTSGHLGGGGGEEEDGRGGERKKGREECQDVKIEDNMIRLCIINCIIYKM